MEKVRLALQSSDSKPILGLLHQTYEASYSRDLKGHHLFVAEIYSILAGFRLNINVIIETLEDKIIIDIVVTGGAASYSSVFARPPFKEAKYLANIIVDFCNNNGIKGHQVKGASTI